MVHRSIHGALCWFIDGNSAIFVFEALKFHENKKLRKLVE